MTEYLSKKAVLEWLTEQYFHGMGEEAWNTAISKLQEKIESGAFDADEMEHINAYWAREGLIKHQQEEIQRLRAALVEIKQLLNENRENDGAFQSWNHMQAWKVATQALSTTTEQTKVKTCIMCGKREGVNLSTAGRWYCETCTDALPPIDAEREVKVKREIRRLREAATALHQTLNTYWLGYCEKADVVAAQSNLCDVLSTATEPTGPYTVRRDEYGHAVAIERNGYTVLHLQPGTERNEQEVDGIVALLNMNAEKAERVREYYRKLEELRNRTKYRDAAIEYEQRMTDICNVLDFLSIKIPGINAPEGDGNDA